jgi:hypothetical protein
MTSLRKFLAFFCVVAVLLAALTLVSAGLLWAILIPLLFVVGVAQLVSFERQSEENRIPTLSCLPVLASRAPPIHG